VPLNEDRAAKARARIREILELLPEAHAVSSGRHMSLEVRKKRFGWFLADHHGDGRIAVDVKAPHNVREQLAAALPEHFHVAQYLGRHGWIGLWLDVPHIDWSLVEMALESGYRLVAPKSLLAKLG
jgi:predicted DNA-binding protein (MmcQ/YjbR family)